jgi:hypothetical protein
LNKTAYTENEIDGDFEINWLVLKTIFLAVVTLKQC